VNIFGVGSEVIECLRVARMIERHGERFINRVYTTDEVRYCNSRVQATQHFAGRWAAKEAVLRALGVRSRKSFDWRNIEVLRDEGGRDQVLFRGAARDIVEQADIGEIFISIAQCRSVATAHAVAVTRERPKRKKKKSE
jgi:holo-[acyl-carrier protein] synthase